MWRVYHSCFNLWEEEGRGRGEAGYKFTVWKKRRATMQREEQTLDTSEVEQEKEAKKKLAVRVGNNISEWKLRVVGGGGIKEATAGSRDLTGEKQRRRPDGAMLASLPGLSRGGETPRSSFSKMKECSARSDNGPDGRDRATSGPPPILAPPPPSPPLPSAACILQTHA